MGSFSYTCAFSDLPIEAGDKVRFFTLMGSPYNEAGNLCESTNKWLPRSFPFKASYNDYGTIEDYGTSLAMRSMLAALNIDVQERA